MAEEGVGDRFAQVRGFQVDIDGAGGKDHDVAWEHVSGGALMIEHVETTIGSDKFQTHAPGHKSVEEITLRGAMTDRRAALCQWIDESQTAPRPTRRTVTITEILIDPQSQAMTPGRVATYFDCLITGYVFPSLAATNVQGNVQEEVRIKPQRAQCK